MREKFGIEVSVTSVGELLQSLSLTPQKPLRSGHKKDPDSTWKSIP
ncbi:winged helix-turn-helix domain-containing protein [Microbulbifer sp. 2205BS26-8]